MALVSIHNNLLMILRAKTSLSFNACMSIKRSVVDLVSTEMMESNTERESIMRSTSRAFCPVSWMFAIDIADLGPVRISVSAKLIMLERPIRSRALYNLAV